MNRDRPSGSGNYETLRDFVKEGKACPDPSEIECRTTAGVPWKETGQRGYSTITPFDGKRYRVYDRTDLMYYL